MKKHLIINCPCCGFRFPLKRFHGELNPILYPLGFACSRGRAKGFVTVEHLPWAALPKFKGTQAWEGIMGVYRRLASACDNFYLSCSLLSPQMTALVEGLRGRLYYPDAYLTTDSPSYAEAYVSTHADIVGTCSGGDYSDAYVVLMDQFKEVL